MRHLLLLALIATPVLSSAAAAAEQKVICNFSCQIEPLGPALGGTDPWTYLYSLRILPEQWNGPLKINDELESYVGALTKNACESKRPNYYTGPQEPNPVCHLEPTYRDVSTYTDAKTGVELIVPGADSEFLMQNCPNHMNTCGFHEAREACQQLGYELHKTLDLPTLRMVKTTGLMKRFNSSDAAKTMADQEFWLSDRGGPTDEDWRYFYDLESMKADYLPTDDETNLTYGLVCAVQK